MRFHIHRPELIAEIKKPAPFTEAGCFDL